MSLIDGSQSVKRTFKTHSTGPDPDRTGHTNEGEAVAARRTVTGTEAQTRQWCGAWA